jgi:hypothetical protein
MKARARSLLGLVVVLAILFVSPSAARADTTYCPIMLYGQWNGVYYYYCLVCNGTTSQGYNMVTADRLHTIGGGCTAALNPDPIPLILFLQKTKLKILDIPVYGSKTATIAKYVGQQSGTTAGVGMDADSTFFPTGSRCAAGREILLNVQAVDGLRYFRVLEFIPVKANFVDLGPDAQAKLDTIRFGQELSSDPTRTINGQIDTSYASGDKTYDNRQHLLTFVDVDGKTKACHVHSKDRMKR